MTVFSTVSVGELVASGEVELKTGPFGTQLKASEYTKHGTPVINVRNIGFGSIKPDKLEFISQSTRDRLSSHVLRNGDIVFGRKGAVERHVFIRQEQHGWFQGSDCLRLRFESRRVEPLFASYYFLTVEHQRWMMNQCSHGATMASLNQGILERIALPLPPLAIQQRIAGILSAYDELIQNSQRRIETLEAMARSLYRERFVRDGDPSRTGNRLSIGTLGDLCGLIKEPFSNINDSDRPLLDLARIPQSSIAPSDTGIASELTTSRILFEPGDTLFGAIRCYLHKVVHSHFAGVTNTSVLVLRPKEKNFRALVAIIASDYETIRWAETQSTGTKMPVINWGVFKSMPVTMPSMELAMDFESFVGPMLNQIGVLAARIQNLRRTRDLLLPRLLSGQINVEAP